MLTPLLVMALAYLLLYVSLMIVRMRAELLDRRTERLQILAGRTGGGSVMPNLGPHAGFILFAFGATFIVLAAMVGGSILSLRQAKTRLASAERAPSVRTRMARDDGARSSQAAQPDRLSAAEHCSHCWSRSFLIRLYSGDPSKLPSALIGKPVPDLHAPGDRRRPV